MTKEEKHIWYDFLKWLPVSVNRQKQLGDYIVDFLIPEAKLVLEIDGSQHYTEKGRADDKERTERLKEMGLTVLRYTNDDVNGSFEGVCNDILSRLKEKGIAVSWKEINLEREGSKRR